LEEKAGGINVAYVDILDTVDYATTLIKQLLPLGFCQVYTKAIVHDLLQLVEVNQLILVLSITLLFHFDLELLPFLFSAIEVKLEIELFLLMKIHLAMK
jgi:hypothetical protein